MSEALVFYTNPMSRGRIARWMLEETGVAYETRYIRYGEEMQATAFTDINPMGKVPALVHGQDVVTECAAICAYLADVFEGAGLGPKPNERAKYFRALFFAAGPVEQATTNKAMGVSPKEDQKAMSGYGDFDRMLNGLQHLLGEGPYICGERFTAADVYLGSQIGWGLQFGTLPANPVMEAYRDRLQGRGAWKRADELDNAAMAEFGPAMPDS